MALWESTDDKGFTAKADYDPDTKLYTVTVTDKEDKSLSEIFSALHVPVFGIDVSDLQQIMITATKLAEKLEE